MHPIRRGPAVLTALLAVLLTLVVGASSARAADDFYTYSGSAPLASYAPGTVLKTRTTPWHVVGIPTPVVAVQLLYRTTDAQGRPIANVTSVVKPSAKFDRTRAVSLQSAYDSLNPEDGPSRNIAGGTRLGGALEQGESALVVPLLLHGNAVVLPDTEGPNADFAAGPEYGQTTLDSIRAVTHSAATELTDQTKFALMGYSGGAIGSNWAAQLAPSYAPDVNRQLVGSASGGVLVNPAHNLPYVNGSLVWAGVAPMAIIGAARAYDIDLQPYLSDKGKQLLAKLDKASIVNVLAQYPGLTYQSLVKPQYADPASIPPFVAAVNKLNMGTAPRPTIPVFIGQGSGGYLEGTSGNKPGIGAGDGVMIAGDVRSLARRYCEGGIPVKYASYPTVSHTVGFLVWSGQAIPWVLSRLAGEAAPTSCGAIPEGNPLTPLVPLG